MGAVNYGKVVLIGAGHVGSAILDSLLRMNLADEIVVVNRNEKKALGVVMDASHTTAFAYSANASIRVGTYEDCKDAQIIINTAGPSIQPGNSRDRMVLLQSNVQVMRSIMTEIVRYTREAVIINVSNPMDILTYLAQTEFDYPRRKMIGTGTLLDTARFNKMVADRCGVDAKNVTGFVLGEHGGTSFIPWNAVNIVGIPFDQFERQFDLSEPIDKEQLLSEVKVSGLDIVELKGYTSSGIALSVCRLIGAIIMTHGDDDGLILPPAIAPIQVVVVPIAAHKPGVSEKAAELAEKISKYARVKLDDSDNAPGWKFAQWEMKGVPLRLEIGPKDLEKNQCVLVRRDTREKVFVSLDELETAIPAQLEALRKDLYQRALENREKRTWAATTMDEVKELAKANTGYIKTMWCGDLACEMKMKEEAGLSSRCMPFEQEQLSDVCPCCGKPAKAMVYWGVAY